MIAWKQRQKIPSNRPVTSTIHLVAGHINIAELGDLVLARSTVHDQQQEKDDLKT